jgi:hypothetical protein
MTQSIIGQSIKRIDAFDKVTGETLYPGDRMPAWSLLTRARLKRCPALSR